MSSIQLIILVACIFLLVRDIKRRGGLCSNFIHSHQAITLLLCSIFSICNYLSNNMFRGHFTLPVDKRFMGSVYLPPARDT